MQALTSLDFPGNIRELENIIERAVIYSTGESLSLADLHLEAEDQSRTAIMQAELARLPFREAKERMLLDFHRHYVETLLRETGGNVTRAAEIAEIQRQYLHRLMKEAGISAEDYKGHQDG
jgi:DNA-binding NtrC family response regulator